MDSTLTQAKICPGQIYDFYGQALNQSGIYYHTLNLDGMGCDSIAVLSLEVTNLEAALSAIPSLVTLDCHVPTLEVCAAVVPNSSIVWSFEDFVVGTENCQTIQWEGQYTVLIESGSCFALKQILVVDLDAHQGNGTAHIFRDEPRVFTFSMHGEKNYPLRKEISNLDIGLPDGMTDKPYLELLDYQLESLMDTVRPDMVFYLAGVDVLASDKLGRLGLSLNGCKKRDEKVFRSCLRHGVPVAVSMGGGYSEKLKDLIEAHANTFRVAQEIFF